MTQTILILAHSSGLIVFKAEQLFFSISSSNKRSKKFLFVFGSTCSESRHIFDEKPLYDSPSIDKFIKNCVEVKQFPTQGANTSQETLYIISASVQIRC